MPPSVIDGDAERVGLRGRRQEGLCCTEVEEPKGLGAEVGICAAHVSAHPPRSEHIPAAFGANKTPRQQSNTATVLRAQRGTRHKPSNHTQHFWHHQEVQPTGKPHLAANPPGANASLGTNGGGEKKRGAAPNTAARIGLVCKSASSSPDGKVLSVQGAALLRQDVVSKGRTELLKAGAPAGSRDAVSTAAPALPHSLRAGCPAGLCGGFGVGSAELRGSECITEPNPGDLSPPGEARAKGGAHTHTHGLGLSGHTFPCLYRFYCGCNTEEEWHAEMETEKQ